jgi:hypothetical protein
MMGIDARVWMSPGSVRVRDTKAWMSLGLVRDTKLWMSLGSNRGKRCGCKREPR